ncbi:MAG: hypothetical protein LV481_13300 [Methylacidiphilales bacterium]|nr:hypothetical protein [Candidatus Methylacidiphilales bacterium]
MANPPPAPAQKKSGLGCFGCGCIILIILAVLFLGLVGGSTYLAYRGFYALTSLTASDVPTYNGSDDVYNGAKQKIIAFNQALQQNQPASLQLSADEINSFIAHDSTCSQLKIHAFIAMTDDKAQAQASLPLDFIPFGIYKDRFFNIDTTLGFNLDPGSHTIHLTLYSLKYGDQTLPDNKLPLLQQQLEAIMNAEAQQSPYFKNLLAHAKTLEIKDGALIVETE